MLQTREVQHVPGAELEEDADVVEDGEEVMPVGMAEVGLVSWSLSLRRLDAL